MSNTNSATPQTPQTAKTIELPALPAYLASVEHVFTRSDFYQEARAKDEITSEMIGRFVLCDVKMKDDSKAQLTCYPVAVMLNVETRKQRVFVYMLDARTHKLAHSAVELNTSLVTAFYAQHTREKKVKQEKETPQIDLSAFAL